VSDGLDRICFVIRLRPGTEAEYRRRHDVIWPELTDAIRAAGIREYTLFRRGNEVFAFAECERDGKAAFRRLARTAIDAEWSRWLSDLIELETDEQGELRYAEEVWRLPHEKASKNA
jgi:L-rhamnose mutarotase